MESPAFPNIIRAKLMKLKMYDLMNIFLLCKCTSSCTSFKWKHQEPFSILIATRREIDQSKKAQCKNIIQAIY